MSSGCRLVALQEKVGVLLRQFGAGALVDPVVDHRSLRDAPLLVAALEAVQVAATQEGFERQRGGVRLQSEEAGLHRGGVAVQLDKDVADVVDPTPA